MILRLHWCIYYAKEDPEREVSGHRHLFNELRAIVVFAEDSLGTNGFSHNPSEEENKDARRYLHCVDGVKLKKLRGRDERCRVAHYSEPLSCREEDWKLEWRT